MSDDEWEYWWGCAYFIISFIWDEDVHILSPERCNNYTGNIYTKHCSHDFCNKINVNLHLIRRKDKHMKRSCVQLQYNFMSTQTAPCGLLHMHSIAWLTPDKNSVFFLRLFWTQQSLANPHKKRAIESGILWRISWNTSPILQLIIIILLWHLGT